MARAYQSCGKLRREAGRNSRAESDLEAAVKIWLQLVRDHPKVLEYQHDLAQAYFDLGASTG
jgi:hypothetical protein